MVIKIRFFHKINISMIVNVLQQLYNRMYMKYFSQMSHKLVYSTTTCFTVSGSLQDSQVGRSSLDTKYE